MPGQANLSRWLKNLVTISREGFELYNKTAVADDTGLTISSSTAFYFAIEISGFTDGTGTVTVTGTDENDDAASVTLTFARNGRKLNATTAFKTITRVQTSGLADESTVGTLVINKTDRTGQPDETLSSVGQTLARFSRMREGDFVKASGATELDSAIMFVFPNTDVRKNDIITFEGESWEIKAISSRFGRRGEHYLTRCILFADDTAS